MNKAHAVKVLSERRERLNQLLSYWKTLGPETEVMSVMVSKVRRETSALTVAINALTGRTAERGRK